MAYFSTIDNEEDRLEILPALAPLLPAVPSLIGGVVGLFRRKRPTLTESQLAALQTLPPPLLQQAVAELEASRDMRKEFQTIFSKYVKKMEEIEAKSRAAAAAKKPNWLLIGGIVGGALLLVTVMMIVLIRRK